MEVKFEEDVARGCITEDGWCKSADHYSRIVYKLLVQTDNPDKPWDRSRVLTEKLVNEKGVINKQAFYFAISIWAEEDKSSYYSSLNYVKPTMRRFVPSADSTNLTIPRADTFFYTRAPFWFNNMNNTARILDAILKVRNITDDYRLRGLDSYPEGIIFQFWDQFLHLQDWLFQCIGTSLIALFVVISIILFNPWLAAIICLIIAINSAELYGYFMWIGIKMSAIPAVVLVVSLGIGVEFTVHISLAFVNNTGTRDERMRKALKEMFAPVVHGGVSTLLGILMLAFSEFKLVVRYYFLVLAGLVAIGTINGLVVLPVLLSLIGPNADVVEPAISNEGGASSKNPSTKDRKGEIYSVSSAVR